MGAAALDQTAERRALLSAGGVCALWPRHAPSEAGTAAADFGAPQCKQSKFAYKFDKFACYMWRGARARVPSQACCQQFL